MPSNYIKRINEVEIEAAIANYIAAGNVDGPLGNNSIQSSSQAVTASYIDPTFISASAAASGFGGGGGGGTPGGTNTQIQYNSSSAFGGVPTLTYDGTTLRATGSFTGSLTGNLIGTASWATNALTASFINTLNQNLTVSGNLNISGNLTVFGTASYTFVSASQLDVGTNTISVNVGEPAQRFGGLLVYDSGSLSHQATASLFWDSLHNHWIYQNASGSTYAGGMFMSGPRNTGSLGDEPSLTKWFIARSDGGDHLNDTQIYSSASTHIVTGSLTVTGGITGSFTGSLVGSSSYALTASYALNGGGGGGVTSIIAGTGISIDQPTGAVTITNTGGGGGTNLGLTYAISIGYLMP
jgi:hypothetical protein